MINAKHCPPQTVLRRWVCSMLLTAMTAASAALLSIPSAAETDSASEEPLLQVKPWVGDFDGMAERREIRALVV